MILVFVAAFLCRRNAGVCKKILKIVPSVQVENLVKAAPFKYRTEPIKLFTFSEEYSLKEWEKKIFKSEVSYEIEKNEALSYVRAISDSSASAMYYKIKVDSKTRRPVISWKWRVDKFPGKIATENISAESEDDFAARVYVIFMAKFILNSKVLEYIWTETIPAGSAGNSPYSKNIKLIVLRTGKAKEGEWYQEERDILDDYNKVFGEAPEHDIGAIAFMTNTEHTATSADAMYDDIRLGYMEDNSKKIARRGGP